MSVFRVEKNKNFTVMSNYHLKDIALSLKAKGLLSLMLSLPENWDYTIKGLACICKDGIDSIKATIKELELNGYILRNRVRNEKGQLTGTEYTIYEEPKIVVDEDLQNEIEIENKNEYENANASESKCHGKISNKSNHFLQYKNNLQLNNPTLNNPANTPKMENPLLALPIEEKPIVEKPTLGKPAQVKPTQLSTNISSTKELNTNILNINQSNPYESNALGGKKIDEIDKYDAYIKIIKDNISFDDLCIMNRFRTSEILEIVELMAETVCSSKPTISICGDTFPKELVKSRYLKIDHTHIEYVLECLKSTTSKINNIKAYLRSCIFNAPVTIDNYYRAEVNHDFYGV